MRYGVVVCAEGMKGSISSRGTFLILSRIPSQGNNGSGFRKEGWLNEWLESTPVVSTFRSSLTAMTPVVFCLTPDVSHQGVAKLGGDRRSGLVTFS